jgi:cytochrome P450
MSTTAPVDPGSGVEDPDRILLELLATPEGRADPYPRYAALREGPGTFRSGLGSWVVTRYAECQQVLRSPAFGKADGAELPDVGDRRWRSWGVADSEAAELVAFFRPRRTILTMNPPDHTRLRGLVARAFTPSTVEALRPQIARRCAELLDELAQRAAGDATVDVMQTVAFPLPVTVIGELLGVPADERRQFRQLVRATTVVIEPSATAEQLRAAMVARLAMEDYFTELIARRRARPADDLLSQLIAVRDGSDRLSEQEMVSTAILLFAAGFETTTNLIGNGLLALLRHPDQLGALRAGLDDPAVVARAVEELLRFDSPVQLDVRMAHRDAEIAGRPIEASTPVLTLLGSANRDPRRFRHPDTFDIGRDEGPPLSFGAGIHHCLGASLARAEGQVFLAQLLRRFSTIELRSHDIRPRDSITLRGLVDLPVGLLAA